MNPQQTELKLFETHTESFQQNASDKSDKSNVMQEKVTESMSNILTEVMPETTSIPGKQTQNLRNALADLFPEQEIEEKNIKKSKEILGSNSDEFSAEQLRDISTEMIFLVENSLDAFERGIFKGLTLKELLHEKSL